MRNAIKNAIKNAMWNAMKNSISNGTSPLLPFAAALERAERAVYWGTPSIAPSFTPSATQSPDLPPCFSSTLMSPITIPRSAALHMS